MRILSRRNFCEAVTSASVTPFLDIDLVHKDGYSVLMNAPEMGGEGGCSNGGGGGDGSRGCGGGSGGSGSNNNTDDDDDDNNNNNNNNNDIQHRTGRHYFETNLGLPRLLRTQGVTGLLFPY